MVLHMEDRRRRLFHSSSAVSTDGQCQGLRSQVVSRIMYSGKSPRNGEVKTGEGAGRLWTLSMPRRRPHPKTSNAIGHQRRCKRLRVRPPPQAVFCHAGDFSASLRKWAVRLVYYTATLIAQNFTYLIIIHNYRAQRLVQQATWSNKWGRARKRTNTRFTHDTY